RATRQFISQNRRISKTSSPFGRGTTSLWMSARRPNVIQRSPRSQGSTHLLTERRSILPIALKRVLHKTSRARLLDGNFSPSTSWNESSCSSARFAYLHVFNTRLYRCDGCATGFGHYTRLQ